MILETAKLTFNQYDTPQSSIFDDVYFCNENGVKETDYVFIHSNNLFSRWRQHKQAAFNIAETGFGTGLNFFRTVQLFSVFKNQQPKHPCNELYFCSTEKFPLSRTDMQKVFEQWKASQILNQPFDCLNEAKNNNVIDKIASKATSLSDFHNSLDLMHTVKYIELIQRDFLRDYPLALKGLHRRLFHIRTDSAKFNVTLDLWYGDATESFSNIPLHLHTDQKMHTWFLDGFAPSKNQDMWQPSLYNSMSRLSAPNSTVATFTSAGKVKRGLIEAGFNIKKQKGFGKKREMLVGQYSAGEEFASKSSIDHIKACSKSAHNAPYFKRSSRLSIANTPFNIIGGGLAGAILAFKLTSLGHKVNLIWQGKEPADGASGNVIGGFYPQLNAQHNYASQIQAHSFLYARHFYNQLSNKSSFKHKWCGALQLGFNDKQRDRLVKMQDKGLWPDALAKLLDAEQATSVANIDVPYDCLYLPMAGWISPPSVVKACLDAAEKTCLLNLQSNQKLISFKPKNHNIECMFFSSGKHQAVNLDNLILAMGHELAQTVSNVIPLRVTRGQVELIKSSTSINTLDTLLCHKGYFTPEVDGFHALGSTYVKNDTRVDVRRDETSQNFATHLNSIEKASWRDDLAKLEGNSGNFSRAAIRCSSSDHLPVVGALPSSQQFEELSELYKAKSVENYPVPSDVTNIFVLTGLGSRGLTTAPLMSEILVCQLLNKPLPLSAKLLNTLNPNRFIVRSLIRQQAWT